MKRKLQAMALAGASMITLALAAPVAAQETEMLRDFAVRAADSNSRLYDLFGSAQPLEPCDLEGFRSELETLQGLANEGRAIARAAAAAAEAGAPSQVDAGQASAVSASVDDILTRWRASLPECERRSRLVMDDEGRFVDPSALAPSPQAEAAPDADDSADISDDPDAGTRSSGMTPGDADATPTPDAAGAGAPALTPAQQARLDLIGPMVAQMEIAARNGDCRRVAELRDSFLQLSFMTIPDAMRDSMIAEMRAIYEEFCAPRPGPQSNGPTIGLLGGFGQARVPQASGGFQEQGGEEVAAGTSPRGIDYFRLAGFIEFNAGSLPLRFGASYGEGSGSSVFDVPSGTRSGVVNGAESPNGSTGISASEGVGGTARVERQDITVAGSVQIAGRRGIVPVFELGIYSGGAWNESWFDGGESFPTQPLFGASFWTSYTFSESDYGVRAGASGTTSGGFSFAFEQDRAFEIREHLFGAGLAGGIAIPLAPRVIAHGGGSAGVFYRDSRLALTEVNTLNFGSDAPGFTIELEDKDKGALFRGDLGAGVSVALSDDVALTIGGSASWFSNLAAPFAPEDGDAVLAGVIAGLGRDDAWIYQGTIGITFRIPNPR